MLTEQTPKQPASEAALPMPQGHMGVLDPEEHQYQVARWAYWPWVWALLFVVGTGGWIVAVMTSERVFGWQAALVNFLYFTPMAAGMVTWAAVVVASRGTWAGATGPMTFWGLAFAPVSLVSFLLLWLGRQYWAGWLRFDDLRNGAWVNTAFIYTRTLLGLGIFWGLAFPFYRRVSRGETPRARAGVLVLVYCLVFSLMGFDLVMALDPHWPSSLFGAYFFISGMYIALAAWTLVSVLNRPSVQLIPLPDFAKLLVAFSLLTTYMMYSQLLPIWYENLPHEVRFVVPRLQAGSWPTLSAGLLAVIYLGPLVLLLPRKAKSSPAYMTIASVLILVGMWCERWWLVAPTLGQPFQVRLVNLFATAMFLGAFAFPVSLLNRRVPIVRMRKIDGE